MSLAIPSFPIWPNWWRSPLILPPRRRVVRSPRESLLNFANPFRWMGADRSKNTCKTCGCGGINCMGCSGDLPRNMQITMSGFANNPPFCSGCTGFNGTFLLPPTSSCVWELDGFMTLPSGGACAAAGTYNLKVVIDTHLTISLFRTGDVSNPAYFATWTGDCKLDEDFVFGNQDKIACKWGTSHITAIY